MRKLNFGFLAVLLAGAALLSLGVHLVHGYQLRRNASALLDRARRAVAEGEIASAEESFKQYLNLERDDAEAWESYAQVLDQRTPEGPGREQVYLVHEQALRSNPENLKLKRRCADLAMELRRFPEARRHLSVLLDQTRKEKGGTAGAELEDLLGQCEQAVSNTAEAENWFTRAIEHDPGRVDSYGRLARLLRTELRHPEAGDATIGAMIKKNPMSGRAYVNRWRYAKDYLATADWADVTRALALAPEDPDVLLDAALASEEKKNLRAARAHFEKGAKLFPKNAAFAMGLARIELLEEHPERAEAALRRAIEARPSLELTFRLADTLILEGKIDGEDGARHYMEILRGRGLGETNVRFLEARMLVQRKEWAQAIPKITMARALLKSAPALFAQLNLMLAECRERTGAVEEGLDALRQASEAGPSSDRARVSYARALAQSGKLDEALAAMSVLVDRHPELRVELARLLIQKTLRSRREERDWGPAERAVRQAERAAALPATILTLIRADLLEAQERVQDARTLLAGARAKDPGSVPCRVALARLARRMGETGFALQILDQAEKELGPSEGITLARLAHWVEQGGPEAKAEVAKLAAKRAQLPAEARSAFLEQLAAAEVLLGEPALARQYWRELADLQPANLPVKMNLFDLAMQAADYSEALALVHTIREIEGDQGTLWRFARATYLVEQVRRAATKDLDDARSLVAEIAERRPEWWGSSLLYAEIAELEGRTDEAIKRYTRAIELGNTHVSVARHLVDLLNQQEQYDQIDHVLRILRDRGAAPVELLLGTATDALRHGDFDRAISLARQLFSERSTSFSDHLLLGRFYQSAGRLDEAGRELRRAVELGPGVPLTWVGYVQYLVQAKQLDAAKAVVEAARKAIPPDRADLALAQCYTYLGDIQRAEPLIENALRKKSVDMSVIRVAIEMYMTLARFEKVEPVLDKVLEPAVGATSEDRTWASRIRAQAYSTTGRVTDIKRGLAVLEQNLRNNGASLPDLRLKGALLSMLTSRRQDAIETLEGLDRSNDLGILDQFILAQLYRRERLDEKYRGEMLKILQPKVKNPRCLAHFIDFLLERNKLDEAERWLKELAVSEPQSLAYLELQARALHARNRAEELRGLLQARLAQAPDETGALARLLDRFGFTKEAERAYRDFVAQNRREPERVLSLAAFLAGHDRTQEAMAILHDAENTCRPGAFAAAALLVSTAPSADSVLRRQVEAWVSAAIEKNPAAAALLRPRLGALYCKEGRYDQAEALYRQVLTSDPEHVEALNNLAWQLALREPNKAQEALELVNRAIEKRGTDSTLVDTRAVALIQAGQAGQAERELRDALAFDQKNLSLALHLAWACEAEGKVDAARKAFQAAEALGLRPERREPLERTIVERLHGLFSSGKSLVSSRR